ncbi:GNAT domain [Sesbania bispinosa]|nr:GNAT domain [Sesbania bispinosa]
MASLPLLSMATPTLFHSVRNEMKIKQKPLPLTPLKDTREPQRNVFSGMKPLPDLILKKTMIGHFATFTDLFLTEEHEDIEVGEAVTYPHYSISAKTEVVLGSLDLKIPSSLLGNVENDEDPICKITNMGILDRVQGKGIGTKMLDFVTDTAKHLGARAVIARVSNSNGSACRFFEKYGFELLTVPNPLEDSYMFNI